MRLRQASECGVGGVGPGAGRISTSTSRYRPRSIKFQGNLRVLKCGLLQWTHCSPLALLAKVGLPSRGHVMHIHHACDSVAHVHEKFPMPNPRLPMPYAFAQIRTELLIIQSICINVPVHSKQINLRKSSRTRAAQEDGTWIREPPSWSTSGVLNH